MRSLSYSQRESGLLYSEKYNLKGSDMEKGKSLNLTLSNNHKQIDKVEDFEKINNLSLQGLNFFQGYNQKKSSGDEDYFNQNYQQENNVLGKLYEIMRRVKIKQLALKMLNSTPSRMLKKMNHYQYSLINDKSQDFSDLQEESKKLMQIVLQKSSIFNFINFISKKINNMPIINPANKYKIIWDVIVSFELIYAFFFIPIMVCFSLQEQDVSHSKIILILLSILFIDIFITCNTGFYKRGVLCNKRQKIWRKYYEEQIKTDIISLSLIISYKFIFLNLNHFKDFQFVLLIIVIKWKKISKLYSDIQHKYILRPNIRNIISLMNLFFKILLIAHSCACIWIVIGRLSNYQFGEVNWITAQKLNDSTWGQQYLYAFYFCTVTMTTVGYGDIAPKSSIERIACTVMVLISAGIFGFSVNTISDILQDFAKNEKNIMEKMFIIKKYLLKKSISPGLSNDVTEYLEYYWRQNIETNSEEEEKLIKQLSDKLRSDLSIESNKIILKDCLIFQNNFSEDVMKQIVQITEEKNYTPEELIYLKGDQNKNKSIYFVQEGVAEVFIEATDHYSKTHYQNKTIKRFKKGDFFGELEFFTDQDRLESIRSINFIKLLKINRIDFINLIKNYPKDYEQFCYIKDRLINQQDLSKIFQKCSSCNSQNHILEKCPYVNYIPNKPKIISLNNRTELESSDQIQQKKLIIRRNNQRLFFYNNHIQQIIQQFQEFNEEQIEDYTQKYLYFDISKCDICKSQQSFGQIQHQGNHHTLDSNYKQNNQKIIFSNYFNNSSCMIQSHKKIPNSINLVEDNQQLPSKINQFKNVYLKSGLYRNQCSLDETELNDLKPQERKLKNKNPNTKINKRNHKEGMSIKQQSQLNFNNQDSDSPLMNKKFEITEQLNQDKQIYQSSQNITNSLLSLHQQISSNLIQIPNNQDVNLSRFNQNTSFIEIENLDQSDKNNTSVQVKHSFQINHQQILFLDPFNGQFEKMQTFQLYYPLNNFVFIIQQLQMDSIQKKKMKNKLLQQQRVAIHKLVTKNKIQLLKDTTRNLNSTSQSPIKDQGKRIGDKLELDNRDQKFLKGLSFNLYNSQYLNSAQEDQRQLSIRESISPLPDNRNVLNNKINQSIANKMVSSEKMDTFNQSQNESKNFLHSSNLLTGAFNYVLQQPSQGQQYNINKNSDLNQLESNNIYIELNSIQQSNQEKFDLDITKNSINSNILNQSTEYHKVKEGNHSPPLSEIRVHKCQQLDIPKYIKNDYFHNIYASEYFQQK